MPKIPYHKPFRSIEQQIAILNSQGMEIADETVATQYLATIGYYRLSGYWFVFWAHDVAESASPDKFVEGTKFEQIIALYLFDRKLRLLFLDGIERIEIALRTKIAILLGRRHQWPHREARFLNKWFVGKAKKCAKFGHQDWLAKLDAHTARSREHFIQNYLQKYSTPLPLDMAVEVWDFGLLSHFLSGMKSKDISRIAASYRISRRSVLVSWVRAINQIRNISAHHSRLWNITVTDQPKLPHNGEILEFDHLTKTPHSHDKLYAIAVIIQYFLKQINPKSSWGGRLKESMKELPVGQGVSLKNMGFPEGWEQEEIWQ